MSRNVMELFPRINVANFFTVSTKTLERNNIETVIEISDCTQENNHLNSVLHVDTKNVENEESFDLIADLIEQKKLRDSNVAIVSENNSLSATLSLTHPIKYEGLKTLKAADIVMKKRPTLKLDQNLLLKMKKWEWKVRKERMLKRSVEMVATQLPLLSVVGLFWLGLRFLQDKVEREHRKDKECPDYDYFDIIRWP